MENFQDKIKKYYNSFNKEKFTNTPPNTRLSLQKFKHFQHFGISLKIDFQYFLSIILINETYY